MKTLALILLASVPLAPWLLCGAEGLRWTGAAYQLAGLFTVLWGLNERPKALGLASLWNRVRTWVALVILRRPRPPVVLKAEGGAYIFSDGRAQLKATGLSLDARVDHLEDQLYKLECEMDDRLKKLKADGAEQLKDERAKTQKALEAIRGEMKEATLGNTPLELFGVLFFAVGIVLSAVPWSSPGQH
jgi:hypothetical protein